MFGFFGPRKYKFHVRLVHAIVSMDVMAIDERSAVLHALEKALEKEPALIITDAKVCLAKDVGDSRKTQTYITGRTEDGRRFATPQL